jgi:hypothetical protein
MCNCQRRAYYCCTVDYRCSRLQALLSSSWKVCYASSEDEDGWLTGRDVAKTFKRNNSYARARSCVCVCVVTTLSVHRHQQAEAEKAKASFTSVKRTWCYVAHTSAGASAIEM